MKISEIKNGFVNSFNKIKMVGKEYAPEIWLAVGLTAGAATIVTACMSSLKLDEVLEEPKNKIEKAHQLHDGTIELPEEKKEIGYSDSDYRTDLTKLYLRTGVKVVKLYAPSIVLGTLSVFCIVSGHKELRKRIAGLTAANIAISTAFSEYRKRVIDEQGEEMDRHYRFGTKLEELMVFEMDKDGNEISNKEKVEVVDSINPVIDYARYFDKYTSPEACGNMEYDMTFARIKENILDTQLRTNGCLYLSEVYDEFGFDLNDAPYSRQVGWLYDPERTDIDNYVNLRLKQITREVDGKMIKSIVIDPNVDGDILSLQWKKYMDTLSVEK